MCVDVPARVCICVRVCMYARARASEVCVRACVYMHMIVCSGILTCEKYNYTAGAHSFQLFICLLAVVVLCTYHVERFTICSMNN